MFVVCLFVSDEDFGERNVSVVLDDVESELIFIDHTNGEMSVRNECNRTLKNTERLAGNYWNNRRA